MQWRITNIVVTGDLEYEVDLYKLAEQEKFARDIDYEPESFPGLRMNLAGTKVVMFPKGKFNIVKVIKTDDIQHFVDELDKVCEKYKIEAKP